MTEVEVEAAGRHIDAGGVVLLPTDTVYGLACDPESATAIERIYALKGRPPRKPAAVMFARLEPVVERLEPGPRTQAAVEALLPGPVTVLLANRTRHFPLAAADDPATLGVRVPRLTGALVALLALGDRPLLQSSANPSGGADPARLGDVDPAIRAGADGVLDAGELPGTPSTVLDLRDFEANGAWAVLRSGAYPTDRLERTLSSLIG